LKPEEIWCKDQFSAELRSLLPHASAQWQPGAEPPDFFVELLGIRFAVEATALVDYVTLGKTRLPDVTIYRSTNKLVQGIESAALQQGVLAGAYGVWFSDPIDNLGRNAPGIKARALEYISETRDASTAQQVDLLPSCPGRLSIFKVSDRAASVSPGWSNGEAKWEAQIVSESHSSLTETLEEKMRKLQAVVEPKILLVENALMLGPAAPAAFHSYVLSPQHASFYEAIFVFARSIAAIRIHLGGQFEQCGKQAG